MLKKKRQQDYFRKQWAEVWIHFEHFSKKTNADDLHKIRVGLKKIRALTFLHEHTHGKFAKGLTKPTDKFFRLSGKIRDAQVATQLVRKHGGGNRDFFTTQRETVAQVAKKMVAEISERSDELIKTNSSLWKRLQPIRFREIRQLENKLHKKIFALLYPNLRASNIHEARKMIKRLIYISGALPEKLAARMQASIPELKSLEVLLGEWHDNEFTMELLEEYRPKTAVPIRKLRVRQRSVLAKIRRQFRQSKLRADGLSRGGSN